MARGGAARAFVAVGSPPRPPVPVPDLAPGFRVLTAPRLGPLVDRFAETLAAAPLPPEHRETVLVAQDNGLGRWLEVRLAERLGVAASLDVRSAQALATNLARRIVPGSRLPEGGVDPFEKASLAWRLAERLEALPDAPAYGVLRAYLDASASGGASAALARRLAALFDAYQAFRPDVLAAWAAGADAPEAYPEPGWPHAAWQAGLWRSLRASTLDHATAFGRLADRLAAAPPGALADALPLRVSVVGARVMPPLTLAVLAGVARHVPVTVYAVAPGLSARVAGPRGDRAPAVGAAGPAVVPVGAPPDAAPPFVHPLLRACGEHLRDYATLLDALAPGALAREPLADPDLDAVAEALRAGTLDPGVPALRQLQAALAADLVPAPRPLDPADRSIRIVDAHSPVRELEALRDHLLDAFETLPGLRPHDCLVVVPDLELYAPLVDAVFVAEAVGGVRLPVHVVEHPHAPALRVLDAFRKALRLRDGRLAASELLDLLDAPAVRRRAGIREDELPDVRAWLAEAGVRWGLDGARKAAFGLPEDDLHTWRFGLDRLLLGYATGDAEGALVLGRLPCDAAGLDGADLLGRFAEWAHDLFGALARLGAPRPLADWPDALVDFVDALFAPEADEEHEAAVFLRAQAAALAQLRPETAGTDVGFDAVRTYLDGALGGFRRHEPFVSGRVTVARPYPLRHTPHRVVAFLGLGDGQYPGPDAAAGYDLVAARPRAGDAVPRRAEKQLFLDTVLAAGERLILSFVGRSQKDGSERPASVVLDAFLDACDRHWGPEARAHLVERHRLQPFHPAYFGGEASGAGLFSFAAQHRVERPAEGAEAARFLDVAADGPDDEPQAAVALESLARAWAEPAKVYTQRRLRAGLDVEAHAVDDAEPLVLGGLAHYAVRAAVLDGLLAGDAPAAIAERLRAGGVLPAGEPGAVGLRRAVDETRPVAEQALALGEARAASLTVALGARALHGVAARLTDRAAVRPRPGRVRRRDLVAAWTEHLALCAAGHDVPTVALGVDRAVSFAPLPPEAARAFLAALLRGYDRIQRRPPPLFDRASHTYVDKLPAGDRRAYAEAMLAREAALAAGEGPEPIACGIKAWPLKEAQTAFARRTWPDNPPGDLDDAYVALVTRGADPFERPLGFVHWAQTLWAPLLTHATDGLPS